MSSINGYISIPVQNCDVKVEICEPELKIQEDSKQLGKIKHIPICMLTIVVIQIIIYEFFTDAGAIRSFCYSPRRRDELWRVVTYTFLHGSLLHLLFNALMLLTFGVTFEIEHGQWKTLLIFFTGGITGALGCDTFDRTRSVIGSSASCSSLLLAHLAYLLINWKKVNDWDYKMIVVGSFVFSDIISWPLSQCSLFKQNLSWGSHLSAGINGILLGTLVLHSCKSSKLTGTKCFISAIYGILLVVEVIIYVPFIRDIVYAHAIRYDNNFQ